MRARDEESGDGESEESGERQTEVKEKEEEEEEEGEDGVLLDNTKLSNHDDMMWMLIILQ